MRRTGIAVLVGAALFWSMASAQDGGLRYKVTDLQNSLPNSPSIASSWANAINAFGSVAGDYTDANGLQYCFIYTARGKFLPIVRTLIDGGFCDARGINAGGDIAGGIVGSAHADAFLYTAQSVLTIFSPNSVSYGYAIDDYKEVVGESSSVNGSASDPYHWSANGTAINLRGPGMGFDAKGVSITPNGSAVLLQEGNPPNVPLQGWWTIWPSDSPVVTDQCNASTPLLYVHALNANSHVIGSLLCSDGWRAALWTSPSLSPIVLGAPTSDAYAISSDDWVVGTSTAWSGGVGTLRVSDPNCPVTVNLNTLLDSASSGWTVVAAYGINASHQIVGQARNSAGQLHAVLLNPDNTLPLCHPA